MDPPGGPEPPPPHTMDAPAPTAPSVEMDAPNLPPRADSSSGNAGKRRRKQRGAGTKPPASATGRNRTGNRPKRGGTGASLQLPQMKITIRNIGDVERHGTAVQVLDMIRKLIQTANEDSSGQGGLPICMDEDSVKRIIHIEESVTAAAKRAEEQAALAENESEDNVDSIQEESQPKDEADDGGADTMKEEKPSGAAYSAVASMSLQAMDGEAKMDDTKAVTARVLYVVPPKRSRRRGHKNGCAYLVLSPPPLPKTPEQLETIMSPAERSHVVAKARLELLQTLDSISNKAQSDSRGAQLFAGCLVEQSKNVKTWKDREKNHRDRREGTIEQTADYRRFMANAEKAEQDRLNRPKPTPGGAASASGADGTDESGQPVAALVLHLRAKREQQRARRKKGSAKKKHDSREKTSTRKKKSTREPSHKSSKSASRREKDKSRRKKGPKRAPAATSTSAPTLLKHGNGVAGKATTVGLSNGERHGKG